MIQKNEHTLLALLVGAALALVLWVLFIIISDPAAFTQALTTPCYAPDCY